MDMDTFVPAILDIEASGFGKESYPIEVGIVFSNGQKFCRLIKPEKGWTHWDAEAEAVHRISRKILERHGMCTRDIAQELNQRLDGLTVYSDCWTVDKPWLDVLFDAAQMKPSFRVSAIEMILDEPQWHHWNQIYSETLEKNVENRHRASKDAELIQQTWLETKSSYRNSKSDCQNDSDNKSRQKREAS